MALPRPSSSSVASSSTRPLQCADPYATFEYTELELATARSMELGKPAHQQGEQLLEDTEVSEGSHDKVLEDLAKSNEKDSQQMPLREDEIEEGSTRRCASQDPRGLLPTRGAGNKSSGDFTSAAIGTCYEVATV